MSYQTRKTPHKPIKAVCYEGQPLKGYTIEREETDRNGDKFFYLVDEKEDTARVRSGTYLVNGKWLNSDAFDALYEKVPEPEPVAAPEPDPTPEEAVVADPDPPAAREQDDVPQTVVAPPAIHPE